MDKILQMLKLQQSLNDATNGIGWENGITKNGKPIDWRRCIYLECAELIESYPWKHWKDIDAKPDYENIKIETVDIWHFILSQALADYQKKDLGTPEILSQRIQALDNFSDFSKGHTNKQADYYAEIKIVEELISLLFLNSSTEKTVEAFFNIALMCGLDLKSLYTLYIGKNILNQFRQDHGYKDGTYLKIWDGREDNAVMQNYLDKNPDSSPRALYCYLEDSYPKE